MIILWDQRHIFGPSLIEMSRGSGLHLIQGEGRQPGADAEEPRLLTQDPGHLCTAERWFSAIRFPPESPGTLVNKEIPEPHPKPAESPAQVDRDLAMLWGPLVQGTIPKWGGAGGFQLQGIRPPAETLSGLKAPRCCSHKYSSFVKSPGN